MSGKHIYWVDFLQFFRGKQLLWLSVDLPIKSSPYWKRGLNSKENFHLRSKLFSFIVGPLLTRKTKQKKKKKLYFSRVASLGIYSPDLALLTSISSQSWNLHDRNFGSNEGVINAVNEYLGDRDEDFCFEGITKLETGMEKVYQNKGRLCWKVVANWAFQSTRGWKLSDHTSYLCIDIWKHFLTFSCWISGLFWIKYPLKIISFTLKKLVGWSTVLLPGVFDVC